MSVVAGLGKGVGSSNITYLVYEQSRSCPNDIQGHKDLSLQVLIIELSLTQQVVHIHLIEVTLDVEVVVILALTLLLRPFTAHFRQF